MLDEAAFTAGDLMTRDVAVVHPDSSLLDAVKLMARRHISGMPVVDEAGAVVGIISEGDLMRWHEGFTDRQACWLDLLAEDTAPYRGTPAGVQAIGRRLHRRLAQDPVLRVAIGRASPTHVRV